ncbi:MAG: class III poly(R)-hydroxyalkanoic acid synthase subunit PhaE [Prochlorothrix sp.]
MATPTNPTVTNWAESTQSWVDAWTQTNTQIWGSWFKAIGDFTPQAPDTVGQGLSQSFNGDFDQLNQIFARNQQLLSRFFKVSVDAWQELLPAFEAGGNWQDTINQYNQQLQDQLAAFANSSQKISQNNLELWQLYIDEVKQFNQLWFAPLGVKIPDFVAGQSAPWLELNNRYWEMLYDKSFSGMILSSPMLGPNREFTGKLLRNFEAWTDLYRASTDYQLILGEVQVKSFENLMQTLVEKAEKGEIVKDWKEFQGLWSQVADDIFAAAFCEEKNIKIRGKFINALNHYRLQQQELIEVLLSSMNLPTRSEVDEVHKTVYELRKQIKQLQKKVTALETAAPPAAPDAAADPKPGSAPKSSTPKK